MYHGFMTHLFLSQNLKVLELNPGQLLPNSLERTMGVILEPEVGEEALYYHHGNTHKKGGVHDTEHCQEEHSPGESTGKAISTLLLIIIHDKEA